MNVRTAIAAVVVSVVLVSMAAVMLPSDSCAFSEDEVQVEKTYYVYGDKPIFKNHVEADSVKWSYVMILTDGEIQEGQSNDPELELDISGCSRVYITESIIGPDGASDEMTILVHAMHAPADEDGKFTVRFTVDGGLHDAHELDNDDHVEEGKDFVIMPDEPTKSGYTFEGWYTDDGKPFDPKEPVRDDMEVHARWTPVGGGDHPIYVDKTYVVTFDVASGMDYTVFSSGKTVTFTVSAAEGFELDGDPRVSASAGSLSNDGLTYTLSDISSDVVVTIDGDTVRVDGSEPAPSDDGFPWIWIVVVLVIVIVALAVVYYYRSRL